ncbi:MAG: TonB family protein [Syntrophaceae bacterium]|nr:TonB family protein [Deltaproteobacteria bacterium]
MSMRLIVCFSVSIAAHILILMVPLVIMAKPTVPLPRASAVPVRLVEGTVQAMRASGVNGRQEKKEETGKDDAQAEEAEEGVSFETEGNVSTGYMDLLKARIFRAWQYPEDAIDKGKQGKVTLTFVLNSKGAVTDIGILATSGTYSLDAAAMAAVEQASPFGPFTGDIKDKSLTITGHFCYVIDE